MSGSLKYVKKLQVIRPENEPGLVSISASGIVELTKLYRPVLSPKQYDKPPEDGILELEFLMLPAEEGISDIEMEVNIVFKVKDLPPWVKGLKVNASENSDIELI